MHAVEVLAPRPADRAEPGPRVAVLGASLVLTATALDVALSGELTLFFDLCFVTTCVLLGSVARPGDDSVALSVVAVLPPALLVGLFVLLGLAAPGAVADADDGAVQVVVSGLALHAPALAVGYALFLGLLALRRRA